MSENIDTAYEPIKVHVVSAPPQTPAGRCRYRCTYQTVKLTAAESAQPVLPTSDDRVMAYIIPLDDPVVVSNNLSDAQNLTGATLPKALDTGSYVPIQDSGPVHVGAATFSGAGGVSRVTVVAVYQATTQS